MADESGLIRNRRYIVWVAEKTSLNELLLLLLLLPPYFWERAPFHLFWQASFWVLFLTASSLGNPTWDGCVKCERSLNVLKVLSGRSWGGDRTVMLQLYWSLVHSKVDYGRFVYCSSTKSKLSIINPIHNTGICLATDAYRTSRLESLHAESGEPPLNLCRNLFLCCYVSKLVTQPHHPLHGAILCPTLRNRYKLNITAFRPVGVRFHQLLRWLHICLPYIIPYRFSRIPSWKITRLTCDLRLIRLVRGTTSPLNYRWCLAELLSNYQDRYSILVARRMG
jgi:hypothetical protein